MNRTVVERQQLAEVGNVEYEQGQDDGEVGDKYRNHHEIKSSPCSLCSLNGLAITGQHRMSGLGCLTEASKSEYYEDELALASECEMLLPLEWVSTYQHI